jgi:hypothetical protein
MAKVKKYEDQLMNVLRFDEADIEANQAGTLSPRQSGELKAERRSQIFWLGFFSLLYFAVLILLGVRIFLVSPIGTLLLGAGVVGLGVVGYSYTTKIEPLRRDVRENRALAVDGRVELSLKPKGRQIKYSMDIGKMRFPIRKDAFLSFKNRDPYCVYYAPHSKQILSVEWLRDDHPFVDKESEGRRQAF